jgi:hypothetical protein
MPPPLRSRDRRFTLYSERETAREMEMRSKRLIVSASFLSVALFAMPAAVSPALAGEHGEAAGEDDQSAEEMAREGMEKILRALEKMMDSVPMYEMPEVTEEGDIIIRRKNPPKHDEEEEQPEMEETTTPEATET